MKYLGLPLGAAYKLKAIWDGFMEKIEKVGSPKKDTFVKRGKNHFD